MDVSINFSVLWSTFVQKMHRKLQTMIMDEHLILLGEIMMTSMSTFGEISAKNFVPYIYICILKANLFVFSPFNFVRSRHCFDELSWPWRRSSSFFLKPKRRSKVFTVLIVGNWLWKYFTYQ